MGICLKPYQNHDHSCGSTKLSLITVPWLPLGSHIAPVKDRERGQRHGAEEERSDLLDTEHVQWRVHSFLRVDHPPARGGGQIFASAAKVSLTVCRKTVRAQRPPAHFTLWKTHRWWWWCWWSFWTDEGKFTFFAPVCFKNPPPSLSVSLSFSFYVSVPLCMQMMCYIYPDSIFHFTAEFFNFLFVE